MSWLGQLNKQFIYLLDKLMSVIKPVGHIHCLSYILSYIVCHKACQSYTLSHNVIYLVCHTACHIPCLSYSLSYTLSIIQPVIYLVCHTTCHRPFLSYNLSVTYLIRHTTCLSLSMLPVCCISCLSYRTSKGTLVST